MPGPPALAGPLVPPGAPTHHITGQAEREASVRVQETQIVFAGQVKNENEVGKYISSSQYHQSSE